MFEFFKRRARGYRLSRALPRSRLKYTLRSLFFEVDRDQRNNLPFFRDSDRILYPPFVLQG